MDKEQVVKRGFKGYLKRCSLKLLEHVKGIGECSIMNTTALCVGILSVFIMANQNAHAQEETTCQYNLSPHEANRLWESIQARPAENFRMCVKSLQESLKEDPQLTAQSAKQFARAQCHIEFSRIHQCIVVDHKAPNQCLCSE